MCTVVVMKSSGFKFLYDCVTTVVRFTLVFDFKATTKYIVP